MRKFIFLIALLLALPVSVAAAKTINVPALSAEQAIAIAKQYVQTNKIDVSHYFIAKAEYVGLYDEYHKPVWRIEWHLLAQVKGGQIFVLVYPDGNVSSTFGE